jgi:hypothetical protein
MTTLTYDGNDSDYTGGYLQNGTWILEDGILRITGSAPSGDARILWQSAANGTLSLDLLDPKSSASYGGIFFRATDLNNGFHWINRANDNRCRLIKVIEGVTQSPDLIDITPTGVAGGVARSLSVELDGSTIRCYQDGDQVGGDITDTFQQTSTLHGIRVGSTDVDFDDFTYPAPSSTATKTITFNLAEEIQGVADVRFSVSPVPLSDSIMAGDLDTSKSTVTVDLDAFNDVSVGDTLMFIATDKKIADDDADGITWGVAQVVGASNV